MNIVNTGIILNGGPQTSKQNPPIPLALDSSNGACLLDRQIQQLIDARIENIVISTFHDADYFDDFLRSKDYSNLNIYTVRQKTKLGSGGALKNTLLNTNIEQAIILNGNSFIDVDLDAYIRFHTEHIFKSSMVLTNCGNKKDKHCFELEENQIIRISNDCHSNSYKSSGIYILGQDVFNYTALQSFSLEEEIFPFLCNENFGGYTMNNSITEL